MPPKLDLVGDRYGRLTVVEAAGTVKYGSWQTAWRCRCDCGAELVVPQIRLRTAGPNRRIDACPSCRSHPCCICGMPIEPPSTAATCSVECHREWRRQIASQSYHRRMADRAAATALNDARRAKRATRSPEDKKQADKAAWAAKVRRVGRETLNAAARERYAIRMTDPDYAASQAAKRARWESNPKNADKRREAGRDYRRRRREAEVAARLGEVVEKIAEKDGHDPS